MTIAQAAITILASGVAQLQSNEHGMLTSSDPEYLHQMRVAVRRLRSGLAALRDELPAEPFAALRAELKWLGQRLGAARDWDVLHLELLPPFERALGSGAGLDPLERSVRALREKSDRSARAAVGSQRYARLILDLGRALAGVDAQKSGAAVLPYATRLIERRYETVARRGAKLARRSLPQLHALRIAVKKLRYALEFFGPLFAGERAKALRVRAVDLQDSLGAINDQATMQRLVAAAMPRPARLAALVEGWGARVVHDERLRLRDLWRTFRRTRRFW